jgi:predicted nuclease of predicted toxin-antitoxin system
MRFLLDENLSPKVAAPLRAASHDVTIAREVGLRTATDHVVIETARREARVLVSAYTDRLWCDPRPVGRRNGVVRSRAPGREPQAR